MELGKVVEGVDETGIHIKELWKINQDYKDVVAQKIKSQKKRSQIYKPELLNFQFQPAQEEVLKSFAKKIGSVVVQNMPQDQYGNDPNTYNHFGHTRGGRSGSYPRGQETVPTFGMGQQDDNAKYQYSSNYSFNSHPKGDYKPISTENEGNYAHDAPAYPPHVQNTHDKPSGASGCCGSGEPEGNYKPIMPYNRSKTAPDAHFRQESNYDNYKNGIYDHATSQVPYSQGEPPMRSYGQPPVDQHSDIEEIKKKYTFDTQNGIEEMYKTHNQVCLQLKELYIFRISNFNFV